MADGAAASGRTTPPPAPQESPPPQGEIPPPLGMAQPHSPGVSAQRSSVVETQSETQFLETSMKKTTPPPQGASSPPPGARTLHKETPSHHRARPQTQGVTAPPQGTTPPPQGTTPPPQGMTPLLQKGSPPSQGITTPPQGTVTPGGQEDGTVRRSNRAAIARTKQEIKNAVAQLSKMEGQNKRPKESPGGSHDSLKRKSPPEESGEGRSQDRNHSKSAKKKKKRPSSPYTKPPPPINQDKDSRNDFYCWLCHREGSVLCCELCPRVYHTRCLKLTQEPDGDWVCPACEKIMSAECVDTQSKAMGMVSVEQLSKLLLHSLQRMKHSGAEPFQNPVDPEQAPNYREYIFHPMDLSTLEKNIKKNKYGCTQAFIADTKWILHNCIIFNGSNNKLTTSARMIVRICEHEMYEIEVCPDCYTSSCTKKDNWFCEPCREPHILVWAKLKGFPFWPAKVLQEVDGQLDVRFFGQHDRAWVPVENCFIMSEEIPFPVKKQKGSFDNAVAEMNIYIENLRRKFGSFEYAPYRSPYDKSRVYTHNKVSPVSNAPTGKVRKIKDVARKLNKSSKPNFAAMLAVKAEPGTRSESASEQSLVLEEIDYGTYASTPSSITTASPLPSIDSADPVNVTSPGSYTTDVSNGKVPTADSEPSTFDSIAPPKSPPDLTEVKHSFSSVDTSMKQPTNPQASTNASSVLHELKAETPANQISARLTDLIAKPSSKSPSNKEASHSNKPVLHSNKSSVVKAPSSKAQLDMPKTYSQSLLGIKAGLDGTEGSSMALPLGTGVKTGIPASDELGGEEPLPAVSPPLSTARKSSSLLQTIESCKAKLGIDEVGDLPPPDDDGEDGDSDSESDSESDESDKDREEMEDEEEDGDQSEHREQHSEDGENLAKRSSESSDSVKQKGLTDENESRKKQDQSVKNVDEDRKSPELESDQVLQSVNPREGEEKMEVDLPKGGEKMDVDPSADGEKADSDSGERMEVDHTYSKSADEKGEDSPDIGLRLDCDSDSDSHDLVIDLGEESTSRKKEKENREVKQEKLSKCDTERDLSPPALSPVSAVTVTMATQAPTLQKATVTTVSTSDKGSKDPVVMDSLSKEWTQRQLKRSSQEYLQKQLTQKDPPAKTSGTMTLRSAAKPAPAPATSTTAPVSQTYPRFVQVSTAVQQSAHSQPGIVGQSPVVSSPPPVTSSTSSSSTTATTTTTTSTENTQTDDLSKYTDKVVEVVKGTFQQMWADLGRRGDNLATVKHLQLEVEKLSWRHRQEMAEMKHNMELTMAEMRQSLELEKQRLIQDLRRQCEADKNRAVEEAKKKQWCAFCGKEAIFYCCWNTSYCDYPCQQAHWPVHMNTCSQSTNNSTAQGGTDQSEGTSGESPTNQVRAAVSIQQAPTDSQVKGQAGSTNVTESEWREKARESLTTVLQQQKKEQAKVSYTQVSPTHISTGTSLEKARACLSSILKEQESEQALVVKEKVSQPGVQVRYIQPAASQPQAIQTFTNVPRGSTIIVQRPSSVAQVVQPVTSIPVLLEKDSRKTTAQVLQPAGVLQPVAALPSNSSSSFTLPSQ
ncbi:protein kinase C-binding protein 1-like isoform X3 [Branchiostoma floridae]|uniref:Protein kinase C-binding protein 1-like isoform X3 n=1 Tax=Branchiostoma floridae TaxID=7739 RepID=A0A9J7HIM9_BRAFL|nr:protein kinase C-binding protein 1-like isoform X3 [Branchiostoma floridae]